MVVKCPTIPVIGGLLKIVRWVRPDELSGARFHS